MPFLSVNDPCRKSRCVDSATCLVTGKHNYKCLCRKHSYGERCEGTFASWTWPDLAPRNYFSQKYVILKKKTAWLKYDNLREHSTIVIKLITKTFILTHCQDNLQMTLNNCVSFKRVCVLAWVLAFGRVCVRACMRVCMCVYMSFSAINSGWLTIVTLYC